MNKFKKYMIYTMISLSLHTLLDSNQVKADQYTSETKEENNFITAVGEPLFYYDIVLTLMNINPNVINLIASNGYKIIIVDRDGILEKKSGFKSVTGYTSLREKIIHIEGFKRKKKSLELSRVLTIDTTLHEIGHAFDGCNNHICDSQEFLMIHAQELNNFKKTSYFKIECGGISANVNTSIEYFASAFACYYQKPQELFLYCPLTYYYFDRLLNINYQQLYQQEKTLELK